MDADAYARQLKQLLPPGRLWRLDTGSILSALFVALGQTLARVEARAVDLLAEWDPRTANETLPDWEHALGLPEDGQSLAPDVPSREAAIVQKYLAQGGSNAAYFIGIAARLGFTVTVDEPAAHTWRLTVHAAPTTTEPFRIGSRIGDRISGRSNTELERVINRLKPAHTLCLFLYLG